MAALQVMGGGEPQWSNDEAANSRGVKPPTVNRLWKEKHKRYARNGQIWQLT